MIQLRARIALALLALVPPAFGQCPSWISGFGQPGLFGYVRTVASFGGDLYVGGDVGLAGGVAVDGLARWNGEVWADVGAGTDGLSALAVFDDGQGPALYVGGSFTSAGGIPSPGIARFDGTTWSSVGGGVSGQVFALAVFDDGQGPALYAGGLFAQAGGVPASNVARWDGTAWSALGAGVNGAVNALAASVSATEHDLYVGGAFTSAGGAAANRIARWDGATWSRLDTGMDANVFALALYDDGNGRALYAGGDFATAGGVAVNFAARWDGASWSSLACGLDGGIRALAVFDAGSGAQLYAGGFFQTACGANASRIARWNGTAWSALPGGGVGGHVNALATHFDPDLGRSVLVAGGQFYGAGGQVAAWDGALWHAIGGDGLFEFVHAVQSFTPQGGAAPQLYVGGRLDSGAIGNEILTAWDGTTWSGHWAATNPVQASCFALAVHDDGTGPALYVGGDYLKKIGPLMTMYNIARFDGASFGPLGPFFDGFAGLDDDVLALASFDDGSGSRLYVGGLFSGVFGGSALNRIGAWDGTSWSDVGGGVLPMSAVVRAMTVFDDGTGDALYVAGKFAQAGATAANNIARWDGASWTALGAGPGGPTSNIYALAVFDDGGGPALYAGGGFTQVGQPAEKLAKWDGTSWTLVPGAPTGYARALATFDDGTGGGPALYVGGESTVARWDGASWSTLDGGTNGAVRGLATWDQGGDGVQDLVAIGDFTLAGSVQSGAIAMWIACGAPGTLFCAGDGSLATACPCGNTGLVGRGCDNSHATGGAKLISSGATSPDTVVLTSSFELPQALSIFLQGDLAIASGVPFGDGVRCVSGNLKRIAALGASGGVASYPGAGDPSISAQSAALGDPIAPGSTRRYQVYYRDPDPSFCAPPTGATWNVSNGLAVVW